MLVHMDHGSPTPFPGDTMTVRVRHGVLLSDFTIFFFPVKWEDFFLFIFIHKEFHSTEMGMGDF